LRTPSALQLDEKQQMSTRCKVKVKGSISLNFFVKEPQVTLEKIFRVSAELVSRKL